MINVSFGSCTYGCSGIDRLPARRISRPSPPGGDRLVGDPQRQAGAPAQAGLVLPPVADLVSGCRNVMAASVVVLERHGNPDGCGAGVLPQRSALDWT